MTAERYKLPKGWVWTTVKEIAEVTTGNTPSKSDESNYGNFLPWVKPPQLDSDRPIINTAEKLSEKGAKLARILPRDSVLVSCIGLLGKVGLAGCELATNQQINSLTFHEGFFPKYGYFYCKSKYLRDWLQSVASATTVSIVNKGRFCETPIPIAPLSKQKRIVEKIEILLDHLNKARQELVKIPPLIKKFRQSVLAKALSGELTEEWRGQQESLESASVLLARIRGERKQKLGKKYREPEPIGSSDLTELPEDWEWAHLSFLSEKIQYGYTERATDIKIGPKFLRITDIAEDGTVGWDKVPYCKCNEANKRKYMLKNGDIVVARTGATTGKNYLVKDCPEVVFASYLISIRVFKEINSEYISYFMSSNYYWNQVMTMQKGTAQPGANATIFSSLVVPVAPLTEQYEIIRRVKELNAQADTIEKCVKIAQAHCQKLAQSILAQAFRGELIEQDSDDEPASIPLEKIKSAKGKMRMQSRVGSDV